MHLARRAFSVLRTFLEHARLHREARRCDRAGLVGIKSAVGDLGFWRDLASAIDKTGRAPDFITIDGGEGGTGAAPLVFADHVALPFKLGMAEVYKTFAEAGVADRIVFVGSGKLGFPETAMLAMALGCDLVNVAREAMLSIGCIQAQRCHTNHCPTGVATQNRWLMRGLDPNAKIRAPRELHAVTLRKELTHLAHACRPRRIHPWFPSTRSGSSRVPRARDLRASSIGTSPAGGLPPAAEADADRLPHDLM